MWVSAKLAGRPRAGRWEGLIDAFRFGEAMGTVAIVLLVTAWIVFFVWLGTAVRALGPAPAVPTLGWAIGAYFIPILNLARPYGHMVALFDRATRPRREELEPTLVEAEYRSSARPEVPPRPRPRGRRWLTAWWSVWLLGIGSVFVAGFVESFGGKVDVLGRVGYAVVTVTQVLTAVVVATVTRHIRGRRKAPVDVSARRRGDRSSRAAAPARPR